MAGVTLQPLKLESLGDIDPRVESLFLKHLMRLSQDCMDRPRDTAKRKVMLEFTFVPDVDPDTGECDEAKMTIEAHSKVPTYRTKSYPVRLTKNGFLFNSEVPEDLNQPGLFADDPREE